MLHYSTIGHGNKFPPPWSSHNFCPDGLISSSSSNSSSYFHCWWFHWQSIIFLNPGGTNTNKMILTNRRRKELICQTQIFAHSKFWTYGPSFLLFSSVSTVFTARPGLLVGLHESRGALCTSTPAKTQFTVTASGTNTSTNGGIPIRMFTRSNTKKGGITEKFP